MFAGDETKEVEIPHAPGHTFTFRNLTGPEVDEADSKGTRRMVAQMERMHRRRRSRLRCAMTRPTNLTRYGSMTGLPFCGTAWRPGDALGAHPPAGPVADSTHRPATTRTKRKWTLGRWFSTPAL